MGRIKPESFNDFVMELLQRNFLSEDAAFQITRATKTPNVETAWYQNKIRKLCKQIEDLENQLLSHLTSSDRNPEIEQSEVE